MGHRLRQRQVPDDCTRAVQHCWIDWQLCTGLLARQVCHLKDSLKGELLLIKNMKNNRISYDAHPSEQSLQILSAWTNEATSYNFFVRYFCTTKHHHQFTKLMQDRISKIRNFLRMVPNPINLKDLLMTINKMTN